MDDRFDEHRKLALRRLEPALAELSDAQIKHVEDVYFAHLLDEDEELRLAGFDDWDFDAYGELLEDMDAVNRYELARGAPSAFPRAEAAEVLTWDNVDLKLDPVSPSWPKLTRAILSASVRATAAKRQRNEGNPVETPAPSQAKPKTNVPLGSALVDEWAAEKSRAKGGWTPATAKANRLWAERFIEMAGDRPMNSYSKADAREFKTALLSLPPNWTKIKGLEKLSMKEAAKRAAELNREPMSGKNVNKVLGFVRAFWNWAEANHDDIPTNPFNGLNVKISGKASDERHPFTRAELSIIFRSPIYIGCRSSRYHNSPGDLIPSDQGIYWVPLVGLFTGCRSGEIIQLRAEDVKEEGSIAYIEVTDEGEDLSLKNSGSRRRIPVHQTLKDIGFLRFVERQRKQKHKRLFPDLPKAADGTYSTAYSTKFGNTLKALDIKHDRISFHSFRHGFEDACRNSRIQLDFVNALQGHAQQGMAGRYGNGLFGLQLLSEEMQKLRYDGLDLSHLITART
ncbi:site-specific integrase [Agrobacterium rhizogenes]|nr:site-specific integrase [Rhizobium rhizogenes]NTG81163.1 site-specific integrase [Rhizobium rhizogenes]NTH96845.1 site-specific integrase [Rhizobium rhizogenes]NTJ15031.1 site-specific integrase [Rhizobium rhizogenes]